MAVTDRVGDLSVLVRRLAHALRQATPDNALSDQAVDYLKRHGLDGSPLRAESVPDGWRDGVESVIKLIEKRRDDYHHEHGRQEPDTGAWNYPGRGEDWMNEQDDLLDEIRGMLAVAPATSTN